MQTITITDAKARLSELINLVFYTKEKIYISKKGKHVAAIIPVEETVEGKKEGLTCAKGILADLDAEIDEMVDTIYEARKSEKSREIEI